MPAWRARSAWRSPTPRPGRCRPRRARRPAAHARGSTLKLELRDHAGELVDLTLDMRGEIRAAAAIGIERRSNELGLDLGRFDRPAKPLDVLRDDRLRRLRRRDQA